MTTKQHIIGFYRRPDERIETILSDTDKIRTDRFLDERKMGGLGFLLGGWYPHRVAQIVPLAIERPPVLAVDKSEDYVKLPADLRNIFDSGAILRTTKTEKQHKKPSIFDDYDFPRFSSGKHHFQQEKKPEVSEYSVLMYVQEGPHPQGRTGVLIHKDKPVTVDIEGKEFIVEVKGVGVPNGDNSITEVMAR